MNIFCILFVLVFIVFSLIFWFRPMIYVIESTLSLIIGSILTTIYFKPVFAFLESLGLKENIYSPSLIFVLMLTIIWAIILTILVSLLNFGHIIKSKKAGIFSIIFSIIFSGIIAFVACLVLHPFLQKDSLSNDLSNCYVCQVFERSPFIQNNTEPISQLSPSVFIPSTPEDVYLLGSDYKKLVNEDMFRNDLLKKINSYRKSNGLSSLELDPKLTELASSYAMSISETKLLSHYDQNRQDPNNRAREAGIEFDYIGENLVVAPSTNLAHAALVRSETHNKNLLSPIFTKVGISIAGTSRGSLLIVEEFTN